MINLVILTDEELDTLAQAISAERERRSVEIADTEFRQMIFDQAAEQAAAAPAMEFYPGLVVAPNGLVIEDGVEYRNVSGAWLSVPPSQYRMGYRRTTAPDPEDPDVQPWAPGQVVRRAGDPTPESPADERSYEGVVYVCIQSHTTQAEWTPPATPALWTPA